VCWEDESHHEANCSRCGRRWAFEIVVVLEAERHRLAIEYQGATNRYAQRYRPSVASHRVPIRGDDGRRSGSPSLSEVKIREILQSEQFVRGGPPRSVSGENSLAKMPITQGPGVATTNAAPPAAHVPVSAGSAVAVGKENTGPKAHIKLFGRAGVKKICS